jgi:hypothetical protein
MKQLSARKVERRRLLAALPVGEKLRMLEEMVAAAKAITATQPPKPTNPVRFITRLPDVRPEMDSEEPANAKGKNDKGGNERVGP